MRRVVVTGIGIVTSLGDGLKENWNNLLNCSSGINLIENFNTEDLTCKIAGFINHQKDKPNY